MEETKVVFEKGKIFGEFQLFSNDKKVGKMDFYITDRKLRVYQTEINSEYRGRGFAKLLLQQLVSYVRENNLRIITLCPYVLTQFKNHPEKYADIWLNRSLFNKL